MLANDGELNEKLYLLGRKNDANRLTDHCDFLRSGNLITLAVFSSRRPSVVRRGENELARV